MYTQLEAINFVLSHIGISPVEDPIPERPDTEGALLRLHEAMIWVQKRGWWFNREIGVELNPEAEGEPDAGHILLPDNTLKVISFWPVFLIERGGKVYDPHRHSYDFTTGVVSDLVLLLTWDELPGSVQDCVIYRAAEQTILHELEDFNKAQMLSQDIQMCFLQMQKEDMEIKQRHAFNSPAIQRFHQRVRPYKRRSGTYNPMYPGGRKILV